MSIKNLKIFGLDVNQYFSDVLDKDLALANLGVNALDLSVIYGASGAQVPVDDADWRSFSNLGTPIWKTLDRYSGDVSNHERLLNATAGIDKMLFGDLDVNGVLSGGAIRYRYLRGTSVSGSDPFRVALADISTSRVSAWSSPDTRANSNYEVADGNGDMFFPVQRLAKISYGSRIKITHHSDSDRGLLRFGSQGSSATSPPITDPDGNGNSVSQASGRRLQTSLVPTPVEFNSEIPTSKIKIHLDGNVRYLYAMKGIPLAFRGIFRSLNNVQCTVDTIQSGGDSILPSWKIVRTNNRNEYSNYKDRVDIPRYRTSRSRERFIELYYPADRITSISMSSASIEDLPVAKFNVLTQFSLPNNNISNFPDFNYITPKLNYLNISNNPLHQNETRSERILTQEITNKMPTTIRELYMGRTFNGSIERNIFVDRFPELTILDIARSGGQNFSSDDNDRSPSNGRTATLPNVPITMKEFRATSNGFLRIDLTGTNPAQTPAFTFTGKYEQGKDFIYDCAPGAGFLHKLAPGAVLSDGISGMQPNTKVIRIKGNVVTVDKPFISDSSTSFPTNNISVNAQTQDDTREVYRNGSWVTKNDTDPDGNNYKVSGRYSIMNAPELETLDIYGNSSLSVDSPAVFELGSIKLKYINMGNTSLQIPNVANRGDLTEFHNTSNSTSNTFFASDNGNGNYTGYKFANCSSLKKIDCYNSSISGPFPNFGTGNTVLESIQLRGTKIAGGSQGTNTDAQQYVISAATFSGCTSLNSFNYSGTTLALGDNTTDPIQDGIHQTAFQTTTNLQTIEIQSNYQISGRLPMLTTLSKLKNLYLNSNRFSGTIPTFSSNQQIRHVYLYNNELYGNIPSFTGLTSLTRLYLHQNRRGSSTGFTSLSEFTDLNNLDIFYCHYNSIAGSIPNFSGCPKVRYLALYNNKFSSYTQGSIASLTRLRYFDVNTNQLTSGQIDKIITDCLASYEYQGNKRRGVTIDLRNNYINGNSSNNAPQQHLQISEESLEIVTFLKTQAGWNILGYN